MGEDQDVKVGLNWVSPFKSSMKNFDPNIKFNTAPAANVTTFNDDYDMGTLRVHVPIKMRVSTGVKDTLTIRVYTWLSDLEYSGYLPTDSL